VVARGDSSSFPRIMGGTMANMAIKPSKMRASISKLVPLCFESPHNRGSAVIYYMLFFYRALTLYIGYFNYIDIFSFKKVNPGKSSDTGEAGWLCRRV
jgi:hypothetical protein